eukprot:CAMPEP_0113941656 /NCGR_PEP_ID=MMETSP1339-20121228/7533_1 /TAXON_ID=94617 /ORGANISM="Fibrocapsa japonica" /LENGTH=243 /DNA_ID=CAMNT_0000945863 /DNA_START=106 /DNA_END=837 /DNA_ORIENTATION=- /assembly_acc=CAM_ASM_000762
MNTKVLCTLAFLLYASVAQAFNLNAASLHSKVVSPQQLKMEVEGGSWWKGAAAAAVLSVGLVGSAFTGLPQQAIADGQTSKFTLPPIDFKDKTRCSFKSSTIGQANAARDKLYDLRQCDLSGKAAEGFDLSGAIMSEADFTNANFRDAQLSKAYAQNSKFDGADFTNGVVDRVSFAGSSFKGAIFANSVLTGTSFEGANLEDTDFTESYMGDFDLRFLCKNPTLKGENPTTGAPTRESAGCRQ